jgi:hypothetical protein
MDIVRVIAGEENGKYHRAALIVSVLGWLSIVWGCMISIWIWTGFRAGSDLWLNWAIAQFVVGAICLVIAGRLQERAAYLARTPDTEIKDRAA